MDQIKCLTHKVYLQTWNWSWTFTMKKNYVPGVKLSYEHMPKNKTVVYRPNKAFDSLR